MYPDVLAVQDFRCNLATKVFGFQTARLECERLMGAREAAAALTGAHGLSCAESGA